MNHSQREAETAAKLLEEDRARYAAARETLAKTGVWPCTTDTPWNPASGTRAHHIEAREVGTCVHDCCANYRCGACGREWQVEIPA